MTGSLKPLLKRTKKLTEYEKGLNCYHFRRKPVLIQEDRMQNTETLRIQTGKEKVVASRGYHASEETDSFETDISQRRQKTQEKLDRR